MLQLNARKILLGLAIGLATVAIGFGVGRLAIVASHSASRTAAAAANATLVEAPAAAIAAASPPGNLAECNRIAAPAPATPGPGTGVAATPVAKPAVAAAPVLAALPAPADKTPDKPRLADRRQTGELSLDAADIDIHASVDPQAQRLRVSTPFGNFGFRW